MKNNIKGLTLTELLIATILIGIVMIAIAAFSSSIGNMQRSSSKSTILILQTAAAMNRITRNAYLSIGSYNSPGIMYDQQENPDDRQWIAFRQDTAHTPENYTDDVWIIYVKDLTKSRLYECRQTLLESGGAPDLSKACQPQSDKIFVLSDNISKTFFDFKADRTLSTLKFYIEIKLDTIYDPSKSMDPIDNPEYSLETRIFPPAHSW